MFKKNKVEPVLFIKNNQENDVLFWRSPVDQLDSNTKILVRATDQMVFEKGGKLLDILDSGEYNLYDKKSKFFSLFSSSKELQTVEMIYLSKTAKLQVLWGTPSFFDFLDPTNNIAVQVGASGELEVQIQNPKKFYLELVGRDKNFDIQDLKARLQGRLLSFIEPEISSYMFSEKLSYSTVVMHKPKIQGRILLKVNKLFQEEYGLKIFSFTLSRIFLSDESQNKLQSEETYERSFKHNKDVLKEGYNREDQVNEKEFNKELIRRQMDQDNYNEYISAVKEVGFETQEKISKPKCPECNLIVTNRDKFCSGCGFKLI